MGALPAEAQPSPGRLRCFPPRVSYVVAAWRPRSHWILTWTSPKCPQPAAPNNSSIYQCHVAFPDVGESETECLNLFIVRPSPAAILQAGYDPIHAKLPVYFYIHGGAFGFGASTDPIWGTHSLIPMSEQTKLSTY
jgi:carboxylesterase type B